MAKSLKNFSSPESVRNEVQNWDTDDCAKYLGYYSNDKFISPIKLRIVAEEWIRKSIDSGAQINPTDYLNRFEDLKREANTCNDLIYKMKTGQDLNTADLAKITGERCEKLNNIGRQYITLNTAMQKSSSDVNQLRALVENCGNEPLLASIKKKLTEYIERQNNDNNKEKQRNLTLDPKRAAAHIPQNLSLDNTIELQELAKKAPTQAQDPVNYLLPVKNSGVYLWAKGYEVTKFLGAGGFGVVWEYKKNNGNFGALKVVSNAKNEAVAKEMSAVDAVQEILQNDKSGRAKKYLHELKHVKNQDLHKKVIKSPLAECDEMQALEKKAKRPSLKANKTIASTVRKAKQALKAVKLLHDAGYSHNDIKPENFLKIGDWQGKKKAIEDVTEKDYILAIMNEKGKTADQKIAELNRQKGTIKNTDIHSIVDDGQLSAEKKVSAIEKLVSLKHIKKSRLQLSDFGLITKISSGEYSTRGTSLYLPPEACIHLQSKRTPEKIIRARDVYSLGLVLAHLLVSRINPKLPFELVTDLQLHKLNRHNLILINRQYGIDQFAGTPLKARCQFLRLIKGMVDPEWKTRLTLDEALAQLNAIHA